MDRGRHQPYCFNCFFADVRHHDMLYCFISCAGRLDMDRYDWPQPQSACAICALQVQIIKVPHRVFTPCQYLFGDLQSYYSKHLRIIQFLLWIEPLWQSDGRMKACSQVIISPGAASCC